MGWRSQLEDVRSMDGLGAPGRQGETLLAEPDREEQANRTRRDMETGGAAADLCAAGQQDGEAHRERLNQLSDNAVVSGRLEHEFALPFVRPIRGNGGRKNGGGSGPAEYRTEGEIAALLHELDCA